MPRPVIDDADRDAAVGTLATARRPSDAVAVGRSRRRCRGGWSARDPGTRGSARTHDRLPRPGRWIADVRPDPCSTLRTLRRDRPRSRSTVSSRACSTPASIRDMSRRFAIESVQPFALGVDRLAAPPAAPPGRAWDAVLEEVGHACLDRGERAPQIVRHGGQERLRADARSGGRPRRPVARPKQPIALEHQCELIAERAQDPALGGRSARRRSPRSTRSPTLFEPTDERQSFRRALRRSADPIRGRSRPGQQPTATSSRRPPACAVSRTNRAPAS